MSGELGSPDKGRRGDKTKPRPQQPAANAADAELAKLLSNRTRALLLFEDPAFDPDAFLSTYLASLSEQAIDNARTDLGALLATCTEEVADVVTSHHQRFLDACAGVEELEEQVALIRNYSNGLTALVGSLKAAGKTAAAAAAAASSGASPRLGAGSRQAAAQHHAPGSSGGGAAGSTARRLEAHLELLLQELDAACAGRDLAAAVGWLEAGACVAALLDRDAGALVLVVDDFPGWAHGYGAALALRKQRLVSGLQAQLCAAAASGEEVRAATRALADLVPPASALAAMLACYSQKVRLAQGLLLKQHAAGSDPDSVDFSGGLCQRTLLEVGAAADSLVAVFGSSQREAASLFAVWAAREARGAAMLLRRNVLSAAAAASSGLHTAVQVVAMVLVHCGLLECSHAISLTAVMSNELWPSIDSALKRHLKRFLHELRLSATEEVNALVVNTLTGDSSGASSTSLVSSGLLTGRSLCREVSQLAELLAPIATPRLAAAFKQAVTDLFTAATQAISLTLRSHLEAGQDTGRLAPLLPATMEALAALLEDGLVDAVAPFAAAAGPVLDAKAADAALSGLYRECQAAARAAKAGRAAAAAAGSGDAAPHSTSSSSTDKPG